MSDKQEIEVKLQLDERDYFILQNFLDKEDRRLGSIHQTNHYLETADGRMQRLKEMLRVREQGGEMILTHKSRVLIEDGRFESNEVEELLPAVPPFSCAQHAPLFPLWFPGIRDVFVLGSMMNLRLIYAYRGLTLELDCSSYGLDPEALRDWELECEHGDSDHVKSVLQQLFLELGLAMRPQTRTKFQRFINKVLAPSGTDRMAK